MKISNSKTPNGIIMKNNFFETATLDARLLSSLNNRSIEHAATNNLLLKSLSSNPLAQYNVLNGRCNDNGPASNSSNNTNNMVMNNPTLSSLLRKGSMLLAFLVLSVISFAGTKTWTGTTSTDWGTASNWSPAALPSSLDDIVIPSSPANQPLLASGTYTVHSLKMNASASFSFSAGTLYVIGGNVQVYGTFNQSGGSLYTEHDFKVLSGGVFNQSGSSLVQLGKNSATAPTVNLVLASGGTINQTGGTLYVRDYRSSPGAFNQNGASALFRLTRDWRPGTGSKFTSTAGTVQFSGTGTTHIDFQSGTKTFNNVVVDAGIDPKFDRKAAKFYVTGNYTNNNTSLDLSTNASFYLMGSANQTITSASTGTNATFGYLTINKGGGTVTLASNAVVAGDVTVFGGTFDLSTYTNNRKSSGGTFYLGAGAYMKLAGTTGGKTGSNYPNNFTTTTISSASTIEYYGSGQTIYASTYGNLVVSSAGTKTAGGALTVQKNFTLSTATFVGGAYTHNLAGNWTMTSGTFTNTSTIINLNGTVNQTISSTGAFNRINVNKTLGQTYLGTDVTTTTLAFTKGVVSANGYTMIIPSGGSVTGAAQATGWVYGKLQKYFSSAAGGTFEVGCGLYYTPVTAAFASLTTAGSLICNVTPNAHPNVCGTTIVSKNIGRYWTLSKPASGAIVYTTATLTFNWNTADNYTGLTASALKVANYYLAAWTFPTISGTPTTTSIVATTVATTGDFAVGEVSACTVAAGFSYGTGLICTNYSTQNAILGCGASAGTFTSTPAGLSINSSTGAINPGASSAGIYTITNTVTGSCTARSNTTVQISLNPSATISYGAASFCQSAGTINPTITGTTGGTFTASSTGLDLDYTTGQIDLTNSDAGTYVVTYTIPSSSPCVDYTTTATITITDANYANIGYNADEYCLNGGTQAVDFEGTTGGTFSSTAGLSINATTGAINMAASSAGTYTVTYSGPAANGCAAFTATAPITITSSSASSISYSTPFCSNGGVASATVTGTTGDVFSSSAGLSVDDATGDIDPTASTAGTYTVKYDLGGCYTTTSVTINTAPSATIAYSSGTFCKSVSTAQAVTRTGTAGGTFSASPAGLSINSSTGAITPSSSTAGTYTVTYTIAASGGCAVFTTTATITIVATPSATISYAGTPFCASVSTPQSGTFSGTAGGAYSSTAGLTIDATTGAITPSTSTPGTYTVTYTISGCSSYQTTTSVTITAAPSASISYAGTPFCKSVATAQSVTQTGTTGGTYSTSPAGLTINSSTGAITPSTSTAGTYTVTYTVAASGGCSVYTTTTSVTITAMPSASISYAGPFCSSVSAAQAVTQTGTTGGAYSSTAGLTIDATTGAITPSTSTAGTYTVTYTIAAASGCTVYTTTTSVTITAATSATISYAGTPFCKSVATAQSVTQTGTTGGTYTASPAGLTINSSTGAITPSTSTAGTYTVTYTVAASGGCSVYTTTASVSITATPSASISYSGTPFCNSVSSAQSVTQTGTSGGTYSASPAGLTINSSTGAITPSTSTAGTYTVTYTVAASGGCSVYSTTASVTITAAPSASISYAGTPFCKSVATAQSVTQTGTTGGTYSASPAGLTINASTGAVTPSTSTAGTYTVTYTVAASGGCALYTTTASVTITAAPSASISYSGPFCTSVATAQSVTQTGTSSGTYSALPTGLTINASTGAITPSTSTAGAYTVTYTVAASGGCSLYSTTTSVTINAAPSATISYAGSPFCKSVATAQAVTLSGTTGGTFSSTAGLSIDATTGAIIPSTSTAGTYTVTYTLAASGGCSSSATTTSVTITSAPSATIGYGAGTYCPSGSVSVSLTGTSGGSYSSTAGLSLNSSTGAVNLAASTPGTYTVTYTVAAAGGCSAFSTTANITITAPGRWTGATSTAWGTASNWQCGVVPTTTTDVVIPSGLFNYPVISAITPEVKSITLQAGAITITNGTLKVNGSITTTGGKITATNGTFELTGTSAQTIPANLFTLNAVKSLTITNSAGVTLGGSLKVTSMLKFGNVNNSVFTTGGYLTLGSTVAGSANVGDLTNNNANSGNTISGNVTVERFIIGKRAYRFLTSPVNSATSIKTNWMEGVNNPNTATWLNPNPGYGTHVTGPGSSNNGFDATNTNNASMFTFNNSTQTWSTIPNTSGTFSAGTPYRILVRGSRAVDLNNNTATPSTTTLRATGTLLTGTVVFAKSGGGGTAGMPTLTTTMNNYSFIGNPYASSVDWKSLPKSDIGSSIYIFDPTISGSNGRGGFVTYNDLLDAVNIATSLINKNIQSGQGFFVQTKGPNPTITFREQDKNTTYLPVFRQTNTTPSLSVQLLLPSQVINGGAADGVKVFFDTAFRNTLGNEDSYKFTNQDENLGIVSNGTLLSLEGRQSLKVRDTLQLKTWQLADSTYTFKVGMFNMATGTSAWLEDSYLHTRTQLLNNDTTAVSFSCTSAVAASKADSRFRIVFNTRTLSRSDVNAIANAYRADNGVYVEWNLSDEEGVTQYEIEKSDAGQQFKTLRVVNAKHESSATYALYDKQPFAGDNYYRIKTLSNSGEVLCSKMLKVKPLNSTEAVSVFPNPIQGLTFSVMLNDVEKGNYRLALYNNNGQEVYNTALTHAGGSAAHEVTLTKALVAGIYQLRLTKGNAVYTAKVVVDYKTVALIEQDDMGE